MSMTICRVGGLKDRTELYEHWLTQTLVIVLTFRYFYFYLFLNRLLSPLSHVRAEIEDRGAFFSVSILSSSLWVCLCVWYIQHTINWLCFGFWWPIISLKYDISLSLHHINTHIVMAACRPKYVQSYIGRPHNNRRTAFVVAFGAQECDDA